MPRKISNRREDARHELPGALGGKIEFIDGDGMDQRLPLIDLSLSGIAFTMPRRIKGVEKGGMLEGVVIRVASFAIDVNVQILHTTRGFREDYTCGARIFPKNEDDRNELTELISRLEKLPRA